MTQIALSARQNLSERKILNKTCIEKGKLMVDASMNGTEGYILNVSLGAASGVY